MSVPVPKTIRAGDTWSWTISTPDYLASDGWTVVIAFVNLERKFNIASTANGNDHVIAQTAAQTALIIPGRYLWTAFAKLAGTERYEIGSGTTLVTPNVEAAVPLDSRSNARQIYDNLIELWKKHAAGQALAAGYTIAGRSFMFKSSADLLRDLQFWKAQVEAEEAAEKVLAGESTGEKLYFRLS